MAPLPRAPLPHLLQFLPHSFPSPSPISPTLLHFHSPSPLPPSCSYITFYYPQLLLRLSLSSLPLPLLLLSFTFSLSSPIFFYLSLPLPLHLCSSSHTLPHTSSPPLSTPITPSPPRPPPPPAQPTLLSDRPRLSYYNTLRKTTPTRNK